MKIKLEGVDKVIAALGKIEKKLANQANKEIAGAALRTVAVAKNRLQPLPGDSREMAVDIAAIRQSINFTHDTVKKEASVFAGNVKDDHLAAYYEFGTGKYAGRYVRTLPEPFQRLAMRFYVNGKGRLPEHPYLIPAYIQESQRLSDRLKNLKVSW